MNHKILFVVKRNHGYSGLSGYTAGPTNTLSTGLWNSARLVYDMLLQNNIPTELEIVNDNNDIDRIVTEHKPTDVIIEALWVVPSKFKELAKLHPDVRWIIRTHSESPFIALEGIATDWLVQYLNNENVIIAINSPRFLNEMRFVLGQAHPEITDIDSRVVYLPNYYPVENGYPNKPEDAEYIDIGCFGATRPMKNQLIQAHAALRFATTINKKLRFHINSNRVELHGDPVMKNLLNLFEHVACRGHELVLHPWLPHDDFIALITSLDIGMQVSFSETFNIVTADFVANGVPVLASREVTWLPRKSTAEPTNERDIVEKLNSAWRDRGFLTVLNKYNLREYSNKSEQSWVKFFSNSDNSQGDYKPHYALLIGIGIVLIVAAVIIQSWLQYV